MLNFSPTFLLEFLLICSVFVLSTVVHWNSRTTLKVFSIMVHSHKVNYICWNLLNEWREILYIVRWKKNKANCPTVSSMLVGCLIGNLNMFQLELWTSSPTPFLQTSPLTVNGNFVLLAVQALKVFSYNISCQQLLLGVDTLPVLFPVIFLAPGTAPGT